MSNKPKKLQDTILYCGRCGISFFWSIEEQTHLAGESQTPPLLCPGCRALLPPVGSERGLVKWYSPRKRYGFITRQNQPDIFLPAASLRMQRPPRTGDLVEFTLSQNEQGAIADDVRLLAETADQ
jgi:CspA family cold shock protein